MSARQMPTALREALEGRRSVRGYRPEPVAAERLRELFSAAQRAPSWCNVQPWRVHVTAPPVTGAVAAALLDAARSRMPAPEVPFPVEYPEPYNTHRRACGAVLYGAMGIERGDKAARHDAWLRNYAVFDAPHLAVVSQDRRLGQYGTLDVGVWLGVLLTVAASMGIDTCPMASIAGYPAVLREKLHIPEDHWILFGVAIGYEDASVSANACRTDRDPVETNVTFVPAPRGPSAEPTARDPGP